MASSAHLKKTLLRLGATAAGIATLLLVIPGYFADFLMFYPPPPRTARLYPVQKLEVAPDTSIALIHIENPMAEYTLLYSHGNAEQLPDLEYALTEYARHGFSIVAYDYEGYGQSGGKPTEQTVCRDIERVYRYLVEERKIPPSRILVYGRSIGSGASCYLASKHPAAGLILEAPFASAFSVVGLGWLPFDRFPNLDRIDKINMPLLIFHGDRDLVIVQKNGRRLFARAKEPKTFLSVPGAGHNNIVFFLGEEYYAALRKFAASLHGTSARVQ